MTTLNSAPPPPPALPDADAEPFEKAGPTALPSASPRSGAAPLTGNTSRLVQIGMFIAGAILLPVGLVVICLGWYGIAHTPYQYDQMVYLVSGGFLGVGITFVGGFLYFGSWIARFGSDLKESDQRLSETLLTLAASIERATKSSGAGSAGGALVVAGNSTTVHRADCSLLDGRSDVHPAGPNAAGHTACRLCRPEA